LHYVVAKPAAVLASALALPRIHAFHAVRIALGVVSAYAEAWLCAEVAKIDQNASRILVVASAFSAGMFAAATAFLPSSFAMYCVTCAAAAALAGKHAVACAACVAAVTVAWPFAGICAIPYGLECLRTNGTVRTTTYIATPLAIITSISVIIDTEMYGRTTWSVLNILRYNVAGGGSELYGTEGPGYYLRNLFLNFSIAVPVSLALPLVALVHRLVLGGIEPGYGKLVRTCVPFPLALGFFSCIAHKEERFMYAVYPLLLTGFAASLAASHSVVVHVAKRLAPDGFLGTAARDAAVATATIGVVTIVAVTAALGVSRTAAQLHGYGAPMDLYRKIPQIARESSSLRLIGVCVGGEWYRFPSSFHLPRVDYRLVFIDSGFDGALPVSFVKGKGGTRFGPLGLNDRNEADPITRADFPFHVDGPCDFMVDVTLDGVAPAVDPRTIVPAGWVEEDRFETFETEPGDGEDDGGDGEEGWVKTVSIRVERTEARWVIVNEAPFLDAANSPTLTRAFYVPWWSTDRNTYGSYRVYKRV
jgi:alpha-1,2-mannosyltransferase